MSPVIAERRRGELLAAAKAATAHSRALHDLERTYTEAADALSKVAREAAKASAAAKAAAVAARKTLADADQWAATVTDRYLAEPSCTPK